MEGTKNPSGTGARICSFLFPFVGVICYFVNKDKVSDPKTYLWCALWGFLIGVFLNLISSSGY